MNITLWIIAGLLAALFLASGATKLAQPKDKLVASGVGAALEGYSGGTVKAIGLLEILGAVGLVLPAAVDIAPVMVPFAAVGLVLLMVGAIITHLRRREPQGIAVTMLLLVLAGFVALGRFGSEAFTG